VTAIFTKENPIINSTRNTIWKTTRTWVGT